MTHSKESKPDIESRNEFDWTFRHLPSGVSAYTRKSDTNIFVIDASRVLLWSHWPRSFPTEKDKPEKEEASRNPSEPTTKDRFNIIRRKIRQSMENQRLFKTEPHNKVIKTWISYSGPLYPFCVFQPSCRSSRDQSCVNPHLRSVETYCLLHVAGKCLADWCGRTNPAKNVESDMLDAAQRDAWA